MTQAVVLALEHKDGAVACAERFCGLTLLERNLRLLRLCGLRRALILLPIGAASPFGLKDAEEPQGMRVEQVGLETDGSPGDLEAVSRVRDRLDETFLVLRGHFVYDRRAVEAVLSAGPDTALSARRSPVPSAFLPNADADPDRETVHSCGLALLHRPLLDECLQTGPDADASPPDLAARLQACGKLRQLHLEDIPAYVVNLRRPLPVACFALHSEADRRDGWRILIDATQKGTLDWPARYLHPVPENALVRLLLPTPVTPNVVTVISNLCAFAAVGLFWLGRFWPAVGLALAVGVLDGVDGKLARVKLLYSRFGDRLDHVLDVIYEPLWYLAIGASLSGGLGLPLSTPWKLSLGIVALYFADRATTGLFKRYKKVELFDRAPVDRFFRAIGARRNSNVLILLAGLALDSLLGALWAVFWLTAVTAAFHALRALQLWKLSPDEPLRT